MRKQARKNRLAFKRVQQSRTEYNRKHKIRANGKNKKATRYYNVRERSFPIGESIFREWLAENIDRFNHRPRLIGGYNFSFDGIIKNVSLAMDLSLPEADIRFSSDKYAFFDEHVVEYIGWEKHDPEKGYYDADRTDHIYDYFPTQRELYINNVFELIIEDCNKMFVPENSLYLLDLDGINAGFIAATDEENNEELNRFIGRHIMLGNGLVRCDGEKMFSTANPYKLSKYDLFDESKAPDVRYFEEGANHD